MRQRLYTCGLEATLDVIDGKWKVLKNKQWRFSDRGNDVSLFTSTNPATLVALNGDEIH
jgi:DNA-binding HxlR family transcriptional regulator